MLSGGQNNVWSNPPPLTFKKMTPPLWKLYARNSPVIKSDPGTMYVAPPTPSPLNIHFSERVIKEVYSLSDTCWERSYYSNPGLTWKRMLTVLFVKALQAPQGTCIETLHTCWCIFWWCSWHSSCRTQEEVGRAARPAQKLAPQGVVQGTWMSSKSKEMITKNHTSIDPKQVGGKQNKET